MLGKTPVDPGLSNLIANFDIMSTTRIFKLRRPSPPFSILKGFSMNSLVTFNPGLLALAKLSINNNLTVDMENQY